MEGCSEMDEKFDQLNSKLNTLRSKLDRYTKRRKRRKTSKPIVEENRSILQPVFHGSPISLVGSVETQSIASPQITTSPISSPQPQIQAPQLPQSDLAIQPLQKPSVQPIPFQPSKPMIQPTTHPPQEKNVTILKPTPMPTPLPTPASIPTPSISPRSSMITEPPKPPLYSVNQLAIAKMWNLAKPLQPPPDASNRPIKKRFKIPLNAELPFNHIVVTRDRTQFEDFVKNWETQERFAASLVYTSQIPSNDKELLEEDGLSFLPRLCDIEGLCLTWNGTTIYYMSLSDDPDEVVSHEIRMDVFQRILKNPKIGKIIYNMKPQLKILLAHEFSVEGQLFDPKICAWILNSDENKEKILEQIATTYCQIKPISQILISLYEKHCWRVKLTWIVMLKLLEILKKDKHEFKIFHTIEMPLVPILASMELYGFGFLKEKCIQDRDLVQRKLTSLEKQAHKLVGKSFLLNSPLEVAQALYDTLGLKFPNQSEEKRKKNHLSTSADILLKLQSEHPLPGIILQHRKVSHLQNHYIDILGKYAFFDEKLKMARIYSTILQTTVPTGRLAFTDPNLQAITHEVTFIPAEEENSPKPQSVTIAIRDSFVSAEGHVLLSADYSQLEVRLMAHFSKDPNLTKILNSGGDVFKLIASEWFQKDSAEISQNERDRAKHVCYGILYGMGPNQLAERMETTKQDATHMLNSFRKRYLGSVSS
eukprot:TRINITY_DN502_c3_g1_i1.p1 TRINITY_DN502_c3_g1~~TRINITY_DN502_c3_g1_i1.p1  ORF type:complete len:706 (-),score=223.71 TRINITY_DN502_c3_g1_i1:759-2876(-)